MSIWRSAVLNFEEAYYVFDLIFEGYSIISFIQGWAVFKLNLFSKFLSKFC